MGRRFHLDRPCEGWVTCGIRGSGVAAIPELIDEVPCENGRLVLVLPAIQGVGPVHNATNVVFKQLDDFRISEEVSSFCRVAPGHILEKAVLEMPVVCEGQNEFDACLAGIINDLVQASEGFLFVHPCRHSDL